MYIVYIFLSCDTFEILTELIYYRKYILFCGMFVCFTDNILSDKINFRITVLEDQQKDHCRPETSGGKLKTTQLQKKQRESR